VITRGRRETHYGPEPPFHEIGGTCQRDTKEVSHCMVKVVLSEKDSLEWALKKLRRKMIRAGLFREMKRRRYYEKPSDTRRRKTKAAERRRRRRRTARR
jgi:small subunit ribosomal protein S21